MNYDNLFMFQSHPRSLMQVFRVALRLMNRLTLRLIIVLSQNKFGRTKVSAAYSDEHCGHWCTLEFGGLSCGTITELVWIYSFYSLDCVTMKYKTTFLMKFYTERKIDFEKLEL